MNVRIFWVRAMKCMYAQTRPRFILSSERVFGGMEFEPMLTPREKIPSTENVPRGGSNPRRCGQRAQALPTELFRPPHYILIWADCFILGGRHFFSNGNPRIRSQFPCLNTHTLINSHTHTHTLSLSHTPTHTHTLHSEKPTVKLVPLKRSQYFTGQADPKFCSFQKNERHAAIAKYLHSLLCWTHHGDININTNTNF